MTTVNINRNKSLMALQELVEQNIDKQLSYMPESFNKQQTEALELFKQRIFLEKTIDEAISFNKNLKFEQTNQNLHLANTAEELINVFKLRSDVYQGINYQDEFPDMIEGLNFDKYDSHSAILFYKNNNVVTGTTRLIFDKYNQLPSEEKFSFNSFRNEHEKIGEVSRLMIKHGSQGLSAEFKNLTTGIYYVYKDNDIDILFSGIKKEHYKLYSKFGGFQIVKELSNYGHVNESALILSWKPAEISSFFKKAFLN